MPTVDIPEKFKSAKIQGVSTIETAENLGITADADVWHVKNLHYQLSQIFRLNPGVSLYLGIFPVPAESYTFTQIKQMQNFAGGDIRQMAVYNGARELAGSDLITLQGVATALENEDTPLSIIYAPKIADITAVDKELAVVGQKNISVVVGEDGAGVSATLRADTKRADAAVSGVGVVLGLVSKAKVHESIGWVQKFPTGVALPAFADGTLLRALDKVVVEALDKAGFLFFVTYTGLGGSFMNDSHNMDDPKSDYCKIELVRTMDKAVRGIRSYLLPELGSPLYINPDSGKLSASTVKHLELVANTPLEEMEKAGELSGFSVEIDADQNVLASSTIEFVIKNVAVGVFRTGRIKIGYALNV